MLHSKQYGLHGDPIIIIHGLFGNSDNWHSIAQPLSEHFQVHCLDLPNHGKSAPLTDASYHNMARLLQQWMLSKGIEQAYVLGHSMGGKVAMEFACLFPNLVKKLIIADIAPVDYPESHSQIFKGLLSIPVKSLKNRQQADRLLADYEDNIGVRLFLLKNLKKQETGFSWEIALDNLYANYPHILSKPTLEQPFTGATLFIKGGLSDYIQAAHKETILTYFPQAKVKIIAGAGHWLHAEKPTPFVSLVRRFCTA